MSNPPTWHRHSGLFRGSGNQTAPDRWECLFYFRPPGQKVTPVHAGQDTPLAWGGHWPQMGRPRDTPPGISGYNGGGGLGRHLNPFSPPRSTYETNTTDRMASADHGFGSDDRIILRRIGARFSPEQCEREGHRQCECERLGELEREWHRHRAGTGNVDMGGDGDLGGRCGLRPSSSSHRAITRDA